MQRELEDLAQQRGHHRAGGDPNGAAHARQHNRLNQDLRHDIAMPRAHGFADADFARPLGDAHQHDVHDHDAAHHQRNAGDRHYHGGNQAENLIDEAADGVRRERIEIVGLAGTGVKARAQQHAGLIQRTLQVQAAARPGTAKESEAGARTVQPVEGGSGDVDRVVQVAAERRTQALLHADHGEWDALNDDGLAERRGIAGEERGAYGVANHANEGACTVLLIGEEPAIHHADIANVRHGRGGAQYRTVLADHVLALHIGDVLAVRAVEYAIAGEGFQVARVVGADGLVALDLFEVLAAAQTARGGDLRHQERLRPEGFGGTLFGVDSEAFNGGAHHDHAGHADDRP